MCNCHSQEIILENFLNKRKSTILDFCNSFKKSTWKSIWGITLNCNAPQHEIAWLRNTLLHYQTVDDCCVQCTTSNEPQNCVLSQFATFNPNPKFPFIPLNVCLNTQGCKNNAKGDFNNDFNSDFFIN